MSTYEISKSSLLSLKAEILRKQEELTKTKLQNQTKRLQNKKVTPLEVKNKGLGQRELNDTNEEEENLLRKSREVLEAKAKLYEKLSRQLNFTDEELEHNRRFLVRFDHKYRVSHLPPDDDGGDMDVNRYSDDEKYFSDEYEPPKNPDEEWVEYVDCLGRSRKCMRKDLEFLKSKDAELLAAVDKDENKVEQLSKTGSCVREINEDKIEPPEPTSELLSSDMRRELLRQQWEKEEEELKKKDDLHYQDILFNEARTHGVGYYGFSKDEDERLKQQEALKKLRDETQQEQQKARELRNLREKQLAARAKAARNRKRARMGLPPEEDDPEPQKQVEEEIHTETEKKKETEEMKREQEKEAARKKHMRPWDIGKKDHYEYTQHEWVDKKRKERPKDFAPPSTYRVSTKVQDKDDYKSDKNLYFSTKKETNKKYYNELNTENNKIFPPMPIINECIDTSDDDSDALLRDYKNRRVPDKNDAINDRGKGVEVPPPPIFDYYGPGPTKKIKSNLPKESLVDSISAGLQFLRRQSEKKSSSKKHSSEEFLF
ncbi:hypothetical protein FQA39_LY14571 [Lamprigera yunnana]|nr:hypothetical protein FQA39_LY14571 [Lamprigera yunnana]